MEDGLSKALSVLGPLKKSDFVLAVDGGVARALEHGLNPRFAIGDWDSLKDHHLLDSIAHVSLNRDKDRSDLAYALEFILNLKPKKIIAMGFTGGRPDHFLAGLQEFAKAAAHCQLELLSDLGRFVWVSRKSSLRMQGLAKGRIFSVLAMSERITGFQISGGVYSWKDGEVFGLGSHGLSNQVKQGSLKIAVHSGILMVMFPELSR